MPAIKRESPKGILIYLRTNFSLEKIASKRLFNVLFLNNLKSESFSGDPVLIFLQSLTHTIGVKRNVLKYDALLISKPASWAFLTIDFFVYLLLC